MLGQQMHMGKRIQKSMNRGKRTLPHYPIDEIGLEQEFESQGFVKHSFLYGLNPQEFIFHSMSGREGISDTALKTANSGYVTRYDFILIFYTFIEKWPRFWKTLV